MKGLKLLLCLMPLVLGLVACGSDEEELPVHPREEKEPEPEVPQQTNPDELLASCYVQWVAVSDATLYLEITDWAFQELQEKEIEATFGVAWSTVESALTPSGNRLNANTEAVDFSQEPQSQTKLVLLMPSTTYYYAPYVNMGGELYVGPAKHFTTMTELTSTGRAPAGVQAIDMGLPSGTKWANMNVGADRPEDVGLFFAWGETEGYVMDGSDNHLFGWATYKWCKDSRNTQTKYCTNASWGVEDDKVVLEFADDAAFINWGDNWRMPTAEDMRELMEHTESEWTSLNGVEGYKFVNRTNGHSIFLPAAGCRVSESNYEHGTDCYYWASTVDIDSPYASRYLRFYVGRVFLASLFRYYGMNIRPVQR